MVMCWAPYCKHYNVRERCRFFRFPKEERERSRWKRLLRRDTEPGPGAYICSCHFHGGEKANGPEILLPNVEKRARFNIPSPQKKKRSLKRKASSLSHPRFTSPTKVTRAQATEEVKQELAEFLETPITIKEEPLGVDPLDIAPSTSNQYCDTEDWLQVKLEPDDDQDMDIVGPKIEDPDAYESITNDTERSPELDRATDSRGPDPIDLMFLDFAERFKQFSASMQLVVRDRICQIFADAETDEIRSRKQ